MSEELFLILHKVRGAPAFDIAIRCDDMGTPEDPGPWWIIPTSGHRAYPYIYWEFRGQIDIGPSTNPYDIVTGKDEWPLWPDHYPDRPSPTAPRIAGGLLRILSLGRKTEIRRRKF